MESAIDHVLLLLLAPRYAKLPASEALKELVATALDISKLREFTGRDEPTVIT